MQRNTVEQQQLSSFAMQGSGNAAAQASPHISSHLPSTAFPISLAAVAPNNQQSILVQQYPGARLDFLQLLSSYHPSQGAPSQDSSSAAPRRTDAVHRQQLASSTDRFATDTIPSKASVVGPLFEQTRKQPLLGHVPNCSDGAAATAQFRAAYEVLDGTSSDASTFAPRQISQKQSRLPPNTVSRKAPRKATVQTDPAVQYSPKVAKARSKNPRARRTPASVPSTKPARKTPKEENAKRRIQDAGPPIFTDLETTMKEETDEASIAISCGSTVENDDRTSEVSALPLPGAVSELPEVRIRVITAQQQMQPIKEVGRSQVWLQYKLSPELDGVRRALGQDNLSEYMDLMEKHAVGETTGNEFEVQERRMFQVSNAGLRRKIRHLVLQQMAQCL